MFQFQFTRMSAIAGKGMVGDIRNDVSFEVYVLDDGSTFVGMTADGNGFKVGTFNSNWYVNSMGALEIKDKNGDSFLISKSKKVVNVSVEGSISMYSQPSSPSAFNTDYDNLYNYLSSIGRIDRVSASTSSRGRSAAKTAPGASITLPTSGELTPATFIRHPFGFMPKETLTQTEVSSLLSAAGWPSKPYDNTLIIIVSSSQFKIPFTMYGKPVTVMSMFWDKGQAFNHDMAVSDFKKDWSEAQATQYAARITNDLKKSGYSETEVRFPYSGNFYQHALTDGKVYIQVSARSASKWAPHDAYNVTIDVHPK